MTSAIENIKNVKSVGAARRAARVSARDLKPCRSVEDVEMGNRPMRDSGISWIGQMPREWKIKRLKYLADIKTGPFGTQLSASEYVDEGIPCLNVKNIGEGYVKLDDVDKVSPEVVERLCEHKLAKGDLIFGRKGAVDKHAIIHQDQVGWLQGSDCIRVRLNSCDNEYLSYYLRSSIVVNELLRNAKGSTMPSMNAEILASLTILLPSLAEQKAIAEFLDEKCGAIDAMVGKCREELERLAEYKKSLIFECVTGKRAVQACS